MMRSTYATKRFKAEISEQNLALNLEAPSFLNCQVGISASEEPSYLVQTEPGSPTALTPKQKFSEIALKICDSTDVKIKIDEKLVFDCLI